MHVYNGLTSQHESEFTGIKGLILRYTGTTYALILLSLFIKALTFGIGAPLAGPLNVASAVVMIAAFVTFPLRRHWRKQQESVSAA